MQQLMTKQEAFDYAAKNIEERFGDDLKRASNNLHLSIKVLKAALDNKQLIPDLAISAGLAWQRVPTYVPTEKNGPELNTEEFKALIREETRDSKDLFRDLARRCQCSEKVLRSALDSKCRRIPEKVVQGHGYTTQSQYLYWRSPSSPGFVPAIVPEDYDLKSYRKLISEAEKYVLKQLDEGKDFGEVADGLHIAQDTLRKILEGQALPALEFCNHLGFGQASTYRYVDQAGHVFGPNTLYRRVRNYVEEVYGSRSAAAKALGCTEKDIKSIFSKENPIRNRILEALGVEKQVMVSYVPVSKLANKTPKEVLGNARGKKQVVGYMLESGEAITPAKAGRLFKRAVKRKYLTTRLAARKLGLRHPELELMFSGKKSLSITARKLIGATEIKKVVNQKQTKGMGDGAMKILKSGVGKSQSVIEVPGHSPSVGVGVGAINDRQSLPDVTLNFESRAYLRYR